MFGLVRLAILLVVLTVKAISYIFLLIFMAFRALWKSNLDPRIKWGVTGGVALLVVVSAIVSSNQPSTQVASTASSDSSVQVQAAANAPTATASPTPAPTPSPTVAPTAKPVQVVVAPKATAPPPPAPAFNYCGAPTNPWHYSFCGGNVIYAVPPGFCSYFNCIASFWTEDRPNDGYVIQCVDSRFSLSGGEAGSPCSSHGGPSRTLYSP